MEASVNLTRTILVKQLEESTTHYEKELSKALLHLYDEGLVEVEVIDGEIMFKVSDSLISSLIPAPQPTEWM